MKKIEKLHRKMSKFICFKIWKSDLNYLNRLEFLKLLPLTVRRDIKVVKLINRIILNDCILQNWLDIFCFSKTKRLVMWSKFLNLKSIYVRIMCFHTLLNYIIVYH
jgi:hypothetical protein